MKRKILIGAGVLAWLVAVGGQRSAVLAAAQAQTPGVKLDDATVLAIFDEVNSADIATARLGMKKASSEEVRGLAKSVANDHEQVQHMARTLATKLGLVPKPPENDHSAKELANTIEPLQQKNGAEFDRAYLQHEIEFHRAAIEAAKSKLLPAVQNEELKSLIRSVLPGFEHHLEETKRVAQRLGYQ